MKTQKVLKSLVLFLAVLTASAIPAYAAFISPTKIYIQSNQSSASLSITNNGDEATLYMFEWERRARSADNKNVVIVKEGEAYDNYQPADPYLIFSPRRIVVRPGETQRIRIFARRPKDMAPGEYRSHLKITSESAKPSNEKSTPLTGGGFGGTFSFKPALAIPVMLRTGKTGIDVKISSMRNYMDSGFDTVETTLQNNSTRTVFGKASIKCIGTDGKEDIIETNGFRLYTETKTSVEKFAIPKDKLLARCASAELQLYANREPDYKTPLATVKVK